MDIVTGGAGFIGGHLVDALKRRGTDMHIIDIKNGQSNDIRIPFSLQNVDVFYHLAALADIVPSIQNPVEYFHTNVTGTLNALEAARRAGCKRFIYAASASCYGLGQCNDPAIWEDAYNMLPNSENDPCNPQYPYALTKYLGEQIVMHWSKVYGIPAISLRLFNVYGPGVRANGTYGAMFTTFMAQLANGKPLTIVGDGEQKRDFMYVSDVVEAFIAAAESKKTGGVYNVGSGDPASINQIADLLGAKERIYLPKRPGEPDVTCADIAKIKNDLGWEPRTSIEHGVQKMLEHINDWKDAKVWSPETIKEATASWFEHLGAAA